MSFLKKNKKLILKITVSIILFTIILLKADKDSIFHNFELLNPVYIPIIVLFLSLNYFFSSVRWKYLLIFKNTQHVTVWYLTALYFIGSFFNNFMPTSIGGDVFKIYRLGKKIDSIPNAFSATFMERFSGVVILILISIIGLYKYIGLMTVLLLVLFVIGFFIGLWLLKFAGQRFKKIQPIYESIYQYKNERKVVIFSLATSLLVQLLTIFTQYFVFMSIGVHLPVFYSLIFFPMIILASFFIPSLNGIGVQDYLYISIFGAIGIQNEVALSASILFHLFRLSVSLIGGVLYAVGKDE